MKPSAPQHYRPAPTALAKRLGEETVILDLQGGTYYGLDAIGGRIWNALTEGQSLDALVQALSLEYAAPAEVLSADVHHLVEDLVAHGLLLREKP